MVSKSGKTTDLQHEIIKYFETVSKQQTCNIKQPSGLKHL